MFQIIRYHLLNLDKLRFLQLYKRLTKDIQCALSIFAHDTYIVKYFNSRHSKKFIRLYLEVVGNGLDLSKRLTIPLNDKKKVLYQICLGLRHIHNFNILHRDLKSSNILIKINLNN